jgi:hypothetical protein
MGRRPFGQTAQTPEWCPPADDTAKLGSRLHRLRNRGPTATDLGTLGTMILFLDFDGVLHEDPCFDEARLFARAPSLAEALEPFPEVLVVLSTSWRTQYTVAELSQALPAALRRRVLDATPLITPSDTPAGLLPYRRHAECACWLRRQGHEHKPWVALDDRPSLFAPNCEQLILCESHVGFVEATARRLHTALARARFRLGRPVDAAI